MSQTTLDTIQEIVTCTEAVIGKRKIRNNKLLLFDNNCINNLSNSERIALKALSNNPDLVIKPADKGGATVLMNKTSYLKEAHRQLYNADYYQKLPHGPIFRDNIIKINDILQKMRNENLISVKQYQYLRAAESDGERVFYLLPKIHKPKSKWPQSDMPDRTPIVSD